MPAIRCSGLVLLTPLFMMQSAIGDDCFQYPRLSCSKFVRKNVRALAIEMEVVPAAKVSGTRRS